MLTRRRCRLLAAALPIGVGVVLAGPAVAQAEQTDYSLVVGVPDSSYQGQSDTGTIDNRLREGGEQLLTEHQLGLGQQDVYSEDHFGAAVLARDLNGDGYDDLVVGAPGLQSQFGNTPGHVYVLFGTPTGITTAGALTLASPAGQDGDLFGSALAIGGSAITGSDGGYLFVGAPGRTVNGKADAGAVVRYRFGVDGKPAYADTVTVDGSLVPGDAGAGDRFGAVLASSYDGAVVGVPDADVGAATDAGEIVHLRLDSSGNYRPAEAWNQDSAGVPGMAETGDHFGGALTDEGYAVGVPGEDVGSLKDAGSVQTFTYDGDNTGGNASLKPSTSYTQDSTGVPGKVEAGDDFGASLANGIYTCQEEGSFAIGSPGEDVGTVSNAGSVTLITPADPANCPAESLSQGGGGIPGAAEAGDHVGAALGTVFGDFDQDEDRFDTLLVGDPGENIGKDVDTGRVYEVRTDGRGTGGLTVRTDHFLTGDVTGLKFGSVLPLSYSG